MQFSNINENESIIKYSKNQILKYLSQEEIFMIVFGFYPRTDKKYTNILRIDNHADCTFKYNSNGILKFYDFANRDFFGKNCFWCVKYKLNLSSYQEVYKYLFIEHIKKNNYKSIYEVKPKIQKHIIKQNFEFSDNKEFTKKEKEIKKILYQKKPFTDKDIEYWHSYEISIKQLKQDKIYSLNKFKIDEYYSEIKDLAFIYTDFIDSHIKIYFPNQKPKFLGTVDRNDIGNISNIDEKGNYLIITKSYKDCRIIRNQGYNNIIWFQSECMIPDIEYLSDLCNRFTKIYIIYDNDKAGIENAMILNKTINLLFKDKSTYFFFPEKDAGEMILKEKKYLLQQILKNNIK